MKINSISSDNFGAFLMAPPQVNAVPVPVIVRTVDKAQYKITNWALPKFSLRSIPSRPVGHTGDRFILHEAILPDTKIRVVGVPVKASKKDSPVIGLKGPGERHIVSIWRHK